MGTEFAVRISASIVFSSSAGLRCFERGVMKQTAARAPLAVVSGTIRLLCSPRQADHLVLICDQQR
jgi:hypothetical protein